MIVAQNALQTILYTFQDTKCSAKQKLLIIIGFRGHSVLQNASGSLYKMPPAAKLAARYTTDIWKKTIMAHKISLNGGGEL